MAFETKEARGKVCDDVMLNTRMLSANNMSAYREHLKYLITNRKSRQHLKSKHERATNDQIIERAK